MAKQLIVQANFQAEKSNFFSEIDKRAMPKVLKLIDINLKKISRLRKKKIYEQIYFIWYMI